MWEAYFPLPTFSFKYIPNIFLLISRFFRKHLCQLGSLVHQRQQQQQQQQLNPGEGGNHYKVTIREGYTRRSIVDKKGTPFVCVAFIHDQWHSFHILV